MVNLGIVGCGDVAFRTYFPGLDELAARGEAAVVACFDPVAERAEQAAGRFPGARAYTSYDALLGDGALEAVLNLTPAPFHREITTAALETGRHVYSEKPLAATVPEAQALIALAKKQDRLLQCAPAVMATPRFQWLRELIAAGRIGRPVLATGQMANMGPAGWRAYTGDPTVFYGPGVGPLLDTGVYILHGITGLLGPARRVEAFGGIAIPRRNVLIGRLAGQTIDVTANDQMLVQLDFGDNVFAQVLSSFATPRSKAPAMEVHGSDGSISISQSAWYQAEGPVDLFLRDESPLGAEGWLDNVSPPNPDPYAGGSAFHHLIAAGPAHFVACLAGRAQPILTAEHACHVLEIILKAQDSAREGRALELTTTF